MNGRKKYIILIILVIALGLGLTGATYALLSRTVGIIGGNYNTLTSCFIVNYNASVATDKLPVNGTLFQSSTPKGGILSTITLNIDPSCSVAANGNIYLMVEDGTSSKLLENGALKYSIYEDINGDPVQSGVISSNEDILLYGDFGLSNYEKNYYIYIWLDGNVADNSYANVSFDGYLHATVEQVETKAPGLYNSETGDFVPFQTLVQNGDVTISDSVLTKVSTSLEGEVVIPEGITQIKASAFRNCSNITSVIIPDTVTLIGNYAFDGCSSLTSIVIPNSVTSISSLTFRNCTSLTSVILPDKITAIGQDTFRNCTSLTNIDIPDTVTSIGQNAFYGCSSLQSINLPNSVTEIGDYAFFQCTSLREISLPSGLTTVSSSLFRMCSGLETVRIPIGITSVGEYAFSGCNSLSDVYYDGTNASWSAITINASGNTALTGATIHYEG